MNDASIPLSAPDITDSEIEAVVSVLKGSRLSLGPALKEFESSIATYAGCAHAVAVNSGTSALHLALLALGIGEGDEVIVPSFTFIAAANVIRHVRATPVFVDIEPRTLNLSPARVEAAITSRTRAIMVVHTFGIPAEMDDTHRSCEEAQSADHRRRLRSHRCGIQGQEGGHDRRRGGLRVLSE